MRKIIILISFFVFAFSVDYKHIKEIYYKSYNYEKMGDYKDAIKVLIPLYKKYPNGYTLNLRLAWLFYLNKNYQNAIKHYEIAQKVAPYSFEPKLGLMRVYNTIGKFNKTTEIGNVLLKQDYYNYYGNYYYAYALFSMKDYKNSIAVVDKMLTVYPTSVLFLNLLGMNYQKLGEKEKAKKIFEDVLILDPNNITAKYYLK
jgi:tetratricopeptide (TPR) repeat protein